MTSRSSIKEQIQRVREQAIVAAVNRLLATKGYDAMTVDEVAAEAGMAKASLYKLFTSKEELAGAALVGVLDPAPAFLGGLRDTAAQAPPAGPPGGPPGQPQAVACRAMPAPPEGGKA